MRSIGGVMDPNSTSYCLGEGKQRLCVLCLLCMVCVIRESDLKEHGYLEVTFQKNVFEVLILQYSYGG